MLIFHSLQFTNRILRFLANEMLAGAIMVIDYIFIIEI